MTNQTERIRMRITLKKRLTLLIAVFALAFATLAIVPQAPAQADTDEQMRTSIVDCRPQKLKLELRAKYLGLAGGLVPVPYAHLRSPALTGGYSQTWNNYIAADYYRTMATRYHSLGYSYGWEFFMSTPLTGVPFTAYVRKTCYGTAPAPQ